jgi:hypothetical protein
VVLRLSGLVAPVGIIVGLIVSPRLALGQDPFEIEVYTSATAARGEWELDSHLSYIARGTTVADGAVAPTEHQGHLAVELTRGITDHWEVAGYLLAASRPGVGVEYAGWRVRSRVRLPESWGLPVAVALGAELEFAPAAYDENAVGLEIRPILEKRLGRVLVDVNPIFERGVRGRDTTSAGGWEFQPSARLGVTVSRVVDLSLEYYAKTALVGSAVRSSEQVHQFYPGVDLKLGPDLVVNIGVGFGTTTAGNRLVFKSRCEFPLGH